MSKLLNLIKLNKIVKLNLYRYISEVKTGPFAEHSNQLWNISGVQTWEKVFQGLIKMYRAEVLSKYPVIQHVFFGSVFTLEKAKNPVPEFMPSRPQGNLENTKFCLNINL